MTSLWNYGKSSITKTKYENNIKSAIKYGLKHHEEENIREKLDQITAKNLEGETQISIYEDKIKIENEYIDRNSILNRETRMKLSYVGHIEGNKIIIEKEG